MYIYFPKLLNPADLYWKWTNIDYTDYLFRANLAIWLHWLLLQCSRDVLHGCRNVFKLHCAICVGMGKWNKVQTNKLSSTATASTSFRAVWMCVCLCVRMGGDICHVATLVLCEFYETTLRPSPTFQPYHLALMCLLWLDTKDVKDFRIIRCKMFKVIEWGKGSLLTETETDILSFSW